MTGIKMSDFTATKSDRLNAEDLMSGPIRVRVTGVKAHPMREDGPVSLHYENENGKPYMPCKSMRRVLLRAWGDETDAYVGRELVLFRNPEVSFGKDKTGGVRISHMSHIGSGIKVVLQVSKGRMGEYAVAGLKDTPAAPPPSAAADAPPTDAGQSTGAASNEDKARAWCDATLKLIDEAEDRASLAELQAKRAKGLAMARYVLPDVAAQIDAAFAAKLAFLDGLDAGDGDVEHEYSA